MSDLVPEKTILAYLKSEVTKKGGKCLRLPVQLYRSWPDCVVLLPGGRVFFVEVKSSIGKLTKGQAHLLSVLTAMGFHATWANSKTGIDMILRSI